MNNTELKNRRRGLLFCLLIFPLFSLTSRSQSLQGVPQHASVSALVKDLNTGRVIFKQNPNENLITASLMKLVTTATALDVLGKNYKFTTQFRISGEITNGILNGDLIIEGGGDPTLGSHYFPGQSPDSVLVNVDEFLKKKGIERINGRIVVDESYLQGSRFPSQRLWEDMGNYYGAPPAALSWRDNSFALVLQSPEEVGETCRVVSVVPYTSDLTFNCRVLSASHNRDSAYIYGLPGLDEWEIRGSIPAGRDRFEIKGALPEPGLTFASEVAGLLPGNNGIDIVKAGNAEWRDNAQLIGQIESPPLSEIIMEVNRHSLNLAADHLLIALGKSENNTRESEWDRGIRVIRDYWKEKTGDYYYLGLNDGSGLAPFSTLSPAFLVEMLTKIYEEETLFATYKNSLSVSGRSGTLKYMWRKSHLAGAVYGKSGSMKDVLGYAGYILQENKSPLVFAVMVNHHGKKNSDIRDILEKWLEELYQ
ncbi:D-alanyl-D-alanine carboxypeptidase/D-alanyl-D-alanine endopeptidase [Anaerophaga thermohalophila]|uniref:D-alanyl-D-alanine carboxypeptidase/D-alanyl-D-alanine endopeptidase n=1 Tax=Anaerophaga thermohalophila TaxID=177400 RepID=UPI000237D1E5|nr:D-alanyl-D-alanine carboxypeptidase/D-alanyl-D-alanine-endopeptidase [Anaerophaga thermohalophila]